MPPHWAISEPKLTVGEGLTVTTTASVEVFEQPFASVTLITL